MPTPSTVSTSRWIVDLVSSITPRSSWYCSPVSTCSVARASRSRLRVFCDLANVHAHSSLAPPGPVGRTTYQSGIRCGQPRTPLVAQTTMRCSARKASTSSSVSLIWSRLLATAGP